MKRLSRVALALAFLTASVPGVASATESGGGIYPNGAESFVTAAVPPPGYYVIDYANYYEAQHLIGSHGNDLAPNFRVDAVANAFRFVHWSGTKVLGFQLGQQAILPYVSLDVRAAGAYQHKSGIGDLTIDPLLLSIQNKNVHFVFTPEFNLPTGAYTKGDLANIGRNYVNFEPVLAFTYTGAHHFEADAKLMYDMNGTNGATNYTSGNEFHADYAVGFTKPGMFVGVAGYYYTQTTDDMQNGAPVGPDGFRGRVFAFGPDVHMAIAKNLLALKWEHETGVRYRTEGNKFWLKLITRVGND